MDKTEMYVKMADCEEIQGQWKPKPGDYISHTMTNPITKDVVNEIEQICMCGEFGKEVEKYEWGEKVTWIEYEGHDYIAKYKNPIWLPRQDQIQEMMPGCNCHVCMVTGLFHFMENNLEGMFDAGIGGQMEKLWLAFYMHKRHKKRWDGEKWV